MHHPAPLFGPLYLRVVMRGPSGSWHTALPPFTLKSFTFSWIACMHRAEARIDRRSVYCLFFLPGCPGCIPPLPNPAAFKLHCARLPCQRDLSCSRVCTAPLTWRRDFPCIFSLCLLVPTYSLTPQGFFTSEFGFLWFNLFFHVFLPVN